MVKTIRTPGLILMRTFVSNGTYTPTPGMTRCMIEMVGGSGGGSVCTASNAPQVSGGAGRGGIVYITEYFD